MISCNDCVTVSDDETPAQVAQVHKVSHNRKRKRERDYKIKNTNSIEIIVIDEEINQESSHNENNNTIIELPDSQNLVKDEPMVKLHRFHAEDELLSDFIEKCLDLENSDGMCRIVNNTIIKAYEESDKGYRKSPEFRRVVLKAMNRMDTDPDHMFSHIKNIVETLKFHKPKKRAQLITLATNLKVNGIKQKNHCSKTKINSIVLDSDDEQKEIPTINLEDEVIVLDENKTEDEKENCGKTKENGDIINNQDNFLVPREGMSWEPSNSQESDTSVTYQQIPIEYEPPPSLPVDTEKIIKIESQIAWCKERIAQLEEAEVEDDSVTSPYILCEKYKAKVVQLYKQVCQLTGEQPIKRRKVRLQVLEGHPAMPVKRLEAFINDNIGKDGNPLFPDFCDVVKCVMVANIEDNLGWNNPQVMREANSLFTQCGRALQKQRQRREYRDLLSRVKVEEPECDPADQDPELLLRLEENRKVAMKKENDLLERYVHLQNLPSQKLKPGPSLEVPNKQAPLGNSEENHEKIQATVVENSEENHEHIQATARQKPEQSLELVNELMPLENGDENHEKILATVVDNEEPQISPYSDMISDEDSNFEPPEVQLFKKKTELNTENKHSDSTEVKIKQEPIDVVQMLERLGDDYTISVTDIEDPHLVIEISSDDDSSDEELRVEGKTN